MASSDSSIKHSNVDVLIIGAGPAGLMAANWFAAQGLGTTTRIVDKRNDKIFTGQADGLQCRTLEVFNSFGFADRAWKESNHMLEICFWNPDENGKLTRTGRIPDTIPGISRWQQVVLHQGRIERFFLDTIKKNSGDTLHVERGVLPEVLEIDESRVQDDSPDNYPITVQLRQLSEEEATPAQFGKSTPNGLFRSSISGDDTPQGIRTDVAAGTREIVHAKYVIGCDGAHSWVRRNLGFKMEGEQTDYIWGVLDAVPVTDFPDIRMRCAIHSESSGSVMVIPREDGLVRLYIQLSETEKGVDRSSITSEMILNAARKIMAPYKLDMPHIDWFTAYQIGQRVTDKFSAHDRVFIAGDACHTHSPKAGQGMNVSMMDTYNLAWKVASVVKRQSPRAILATYQSERRKIAQDLIAFDHKFSRLFSGKPAKDAADEAGISLDEFKRVFEVGNRFASGVAVQYPPSLLVAKGADVQGDGSDVLASKIEGKPALSSESAGEGRIVLGMRLNTAQVVLQADARPWQLADWMPSDGRWRIVLFSGDIRDKAQLSRVNAFGDYLQKHLIPQYTPSSADFDAIIEVLTVHASPRKEVELTDFHEALRPETTRWHHAGSGGKGTQTKARSTDYWKIFADDESYHEGHGRAYETYGINPQRGAVVVLRPDGYVSLLSELEDTSLVSDFFSAVLKPADQHAVQSQTRAGSGSGATTARDTGFNGSKAQSETPTPQVVGDAAIQGAGAA